MLQKAEVAFWNLPPSHTLFAMQPVANAPEYEPGEALLEGCPGLSQSATPEPIANGGHRQTCAFLLPSLSLRLHSLFQVLVAKQTCAPFCLDTSDLSQHPGNGPPLAPPVFF